MASGAESRGMIGMKAVLVDTDVESDNAVHLLRVPVCQCNCKGHAGRSAEQTSSLVAQGQKRDANDELRDAAMLVCAQISLRSVLIYACDWLSCITCCLSISPAELVVSCRC